MQGRAPLVCTPVLGISLWEHAYFTQYQGDKEAYLNAYWNHVDWEKVSAAFEEHNLAGKVAPILE